jgi:hypothetical protein
MQPPQRAPGRVGRMPQEHLDPPPTYDDRHGGGIRSSPAGLIAPVERQRAVPVV